MMQKEGRQSAGSAATAVDAASARRKLLESLACPGCARPLEVQSARIEGPAATLSCSACHRRWPIRQRTPAFLPAEREMPVPTGAVTLLHAPDVERWRSLRDALAQSDPHLCAEVLDVSRDDWRFLLPLRPGAHVLVLGCGWGRLAASLSDLCDRVYAVDAEHTRARFVNARAFAEGHGNLLGITARLGTLPFPPASFDIVVVEAASALGPAGDWRHLLANLVRLRSLLAPDGALLLRGDPADNGLAAGRRARRWQRLLGEAGFARVDDLLALPDCGTNSYVLQMGPGVPPERALAAYARHYLEPKTLARRVARWWLQSGRVPAGAGWLFPSHWLLASPDRSLRTPVLQHSELPEGPWGVLAVRSRPYQGARAHFAAFDVQTARPRFLVKVARDASAAEVVHDEHDVLERLQRILSPELRATVPASLGRFDVHGHPAAAQSHLQGRTLAQLLHETPRRRRPQVAGQLLAAAARWLGRFHRETSRTGVLTPEILDRLVLSELHRCLDLCDPPQQAKGLIEALARNARTLEGQSMPLVCEHRDFWAKNILLDGHTVRVVDWDLALFDHLPLGDLYELVHSLGFVLAGDTGSLARVEEMMDLAYGGSGVFSQAVGSVVQAYCDGLGIRPEWGRILLPLLMARKATLHAERFRSGMDQQWLAIGGRYLKSPGSFPAAIGLPGAEATKGRRP